jgi:hypothetical protein
MVTESPKNREAVTKEGIKAELLVTSHGDRVTKKQECGHQGKDENEI